MFAFYELNPFIVSYINGAIQNAAVLYLCIILLGGGCGFCVMCMYSHIDLSFDLFSTSVNCAL